MSTPADPAGAVPDPPNAAAPAAGALTAAERAALAADTVELCARLIRFDTSNYGGGRSNGELDAAEWVAEQLTDAGLEPTVLESAPGRANTVVRIPGADRSAPALLAHGHLDVVPAEAADWSFDPFAGEVRDDAVWGRGALDMKDMDAMLLAFTRHLARTGARPPRDIVMVFVADEEDTGEYGAGFLVDKHPGLFEGVTAAISESGGHLVQLPGGGRLYPIAAAERGSAWLTVTARGTAGHGSRRSPDNALVKLAAAIGRIAAHDWPIRVVPTVRALLDGLSAHLGRTLDPADLSPLGAAAHLVSGTLADTLNPTMLNAGYKHNVIPSEATAALDGRILPGTEAEFFGTLDELLGPGISRTGDFSAPVSADHHAPDFAAMAAALRAYDPEALVLPYCMTGGTDAKAFARIGIPGFGFVPGQTGADFDAWKYVHGVDEHIPTASLAFGSAVLTTYLLSNPRAHAA
jgi:acetylornithine deacetylase/succinyl-diaminopimelate desuccinylase-like protein